MSSARRGGSHPHQPHQYKRMYTNNYPGKTLMLASLHFRLCFVWHLRKLSGYDGAGFKSNHPLTRPDYLNQGLNRIGNRIQASPVNLSRSLLAFTTKVGLCPKTAFFVCFVSLPYGVFLFLKLSTLWPWLVMVSISALFPSFALVIVFQATRVLCN